MHRSIDINPSECRVTRDRLSTFGASTCVIIAALNRETGTGLLGHLTHDNIIDGELVEDAVEAIAHLGPGNNTQICLAGGAIYLYDEEFPESREYNQGVEDRIRQMASQNDIPLPNITVSWLWGNDEASAMVDCRSGKITVKESYIGDIFSD